MFASVMFGRTIEDIGLKAMERSPTLMPVLLQFLRDSDPSVAKQSIVSGTNLFCRVLEEMVLQVSFFIAIDYFINMNKDLKGDIFHNLVHGFGSVSASTLPFQILV